MVTIFIFDAHHQLFLGCFCMLSELAKVFERKVCPVQVAFLHNAACALHCQQIFAKIFFVIFDIVVKKQIEYGLAWQW